MDLVVVVVVVVYKSYVVLLLFDCELRAAHRSNGFCLFLRVKAEKAERVF
jgi:hypothetical protein